MFDSNAETAKKGESLKDGLQFWDALKLLLLLRNWMTFYQITLNSKDKKSVKSITHLF